MKFRLAVAVAALCCAFAGFHPAIARTSASDANNASNVIPIPFKAKNGDAYTVRVTVTEKKTKGGDVTTNTSMTSVYDGRVIGESDAGYTLEWVQKSFEPKVLSDKTGEAAQQTQMMADLVAAVADMPTRFETDAAGSPTKILDWAEQSNKLVDAMRAQLPQAMKKRIFEVAKAKGKEENKEKVEGFVDSTVENMIQGLILRHDGDSAVELFDEAVLIGAVQHTAFPLKEPLKGYGVAPARFGEGDVAHASEVMLTRYDKEADVAEFKWETKFDPAETTKLMVDTLMSQFVAAAGLPEDKAAEVRKAFEAIRVTRVDTGAASVGIATGWARRIEQRKTTTVVAPGQPQNVETEVTLIEIEKANP